MCCGRRRCWPRCSSGAVLASMSRLRMTRRALLRENRAMCSAARPRDTAFLISTSAIACRRLWQTEPNLLRGLMEGFHARTLADRGFGADLGYSAAIDVLPHVPTLVAEEEAAQVMAPVLLLHSDRPPAPDFGEVRP